MNSKYLKVFYETNTGQSASGGNSGTASSGNAGNAGGASGAGVTGNSSQTSGNATGSTNGGGAGATSSDWMQGFNDESRAFANTKGFKDPNDVINSYKHLEKAIGAPKDRVLIKPDKSDDAQAMGQFYDSLGRPKSAAEYSFENMPKSGVDAEFLENVKASFHESGLNNAQANTIVQKYTDFLAKRQEAGVAARAKQEHDAASSLQKEWGMAYEQNDSLAQEALNQFGVDKSTFEKFKSAMGPAEAVKFFYNLGSKMGESSFAIGSGNRGGMNTPEGARAELSRLQTDQGFVALISNGDMAAQKKMLDLQKQAWPEMYGK